MRRQPRGFDPEVIRVTRMNASLAQARPVDVPSSASLVESLPPGYDVAPYQGVLRSEAGRAALRTTVEEHAAELRARKEAAEAQAEAAGLPNGEDQFGFSRNDGRVLRGQEAAVKLLARADAPGTAADARAGLVRDAIELLEAASNNRGATFFANFPGLLRNLPRKPWPSSVCGLSLRSPRGLAIDLSRAPGPGEDASKIDPTPSSFWKARPKEELSPAALYLGPWWKPAARPPMPSASGEVLRFAEARSLDGSGSHPSVEVARPAVEGAAEKKDKVTYKVKFFPEQLFAEEPIVSRLLHAAGYNTLPVYSVPGQRLELEPRAVVEAHRARPTLRLLGLKVWNGHSPAEYVDRVFLSSGDALEGKAAVKALRRAARDPEVLAGIEKVRVKNFSLAVKGATRAKAVGPWDPDALSHADRRAVRALGIASSWLIGQDYKTMNFRLDVEKKEIDGSEVPSVIHFLSDLGQQMEPNRIDHVSRRVGADPTGCWHHNNANFFRLAAFDRMTVEDARWGLRKLGALSEEQILACFAAAEAPAAVTLFAFERYLARRDDLVRTFELEDEVGLLRPTGARFLNVSGDVSLRFPGEADQGPAEVTLEGAGYSIVQGRLEKDGARRVGKRSIQNYVCWTSDPRDSGPLRADSDHREMPALA